MVYHHQDRTKSLVTITAPPQMPVIEDSNSVRLHTTTSTTTMTPEGAATTARRNIELLWSLRCQILMQFLHSGHESLWIDTSSHLLRKVHQGNRREDRAGYRKLVAQNLSRT
jgi:hypothetical protein